MSGGMSEKHFVLVHGACHGAWCWYKLKPLLQNAGHRVTALDMAACGINPTRIEEVQTLRDYSEPLIEFLAAQPEDQKVILVGHSLGGLSLSIAMEMFPEKIEIAVFLAAFMPDDQHTPFFIFDKFAEVNSEGDFWLDTEFENSGDPRETRTTMLFGSKFLSKMYHLSPREDLELIMMLKRPSSMFSHDLWKPETKLSEDKYGSVKRVYVVCTEDQAIIQVYQRWLANNSGVMEVEELEGADHMPMFCMPQELCDCLIKIASN
ncbi:salicylic acid-binding protein 2-like [Silene latifolia]|uniref:salicylic acid-binding protein 2-like n=1 Tax=Silene latifolia TaxID=37657 RepID=UPI003D77C815